MLSQIVIIGLIACYTPAAEHLEIRRQLLS
jgi:hypothetical protein